jgi:hypothetical protein
MPKNVTKDNKISLDLISQDVELASETLSTIASITSFGYRLVRSMECDTNGQWIMISLWNHSNL